MELAESVGEIFEREGAVLEVDSALKAGVLEGSVCLNGEGACPAGGKV
jgi:hypothetical protein